MSAIVKKFMKRSLKEDLMAKPLKDQLWHWKSALVYVAVLMYAIDIPIQLTIFDDTWSAFGSLALMIILGLESYLRIMKRKTWLGAKFAPIFSALSIILLPLFYI